MRLGRKLFFNELLQMEGKKVIVKADEGDQRCEVGLVANGLQTWVFLDNENYSYVFDNSGNKVTNFEVYSVGRSYKNGKKESQNNRNFV